MVFINIIYVGEQTSESTRAVTSLAKQLVEKLVNVGFQFTRDDPEENEPSHIDLYIKGTTKDATYVLIGQAISEFNKAFKIGVSKHYEEE